MMYVIIAVVVIAVVAGFIFSSKRNKAIMEKGVEAEAVVSRVDENETTNDDGSRDVNYTYYVKYQNEAGETVEARLGNAPARCYEGMSLRIKYLPEKPKYAIPAE